MGVKLVVNVPSPPAIGGTINCFGKRLIEFDSIIHFVKYVCPAVNAAIEAMYGTTSINV